MIWPLKLKYRNPGRLLKREKIDPPEGTWVYNAGRFHSKHGGNQGTKGKVITVRPPMHAYWGDVSR